MKARFKKNKYEDRLGRIEDVFFRKYQKSAIRCVVKCWNETRRNLINYEHERIIPLKSRNKMLYNFEGKKYKVKIPCRLKSIAYLKDKKVESYTKSLKSDKHGNFILRNYIKYYYNRDKQKLMFINSRIHRKYSQLL